MRKHELKSEKEENKLINQRPKGSAAIGEKFWIWKMFPFFCCFFPRFQINFVQFKFEWKNSFCSFSQRMFSNASWLWNWPYACVCLHGSLESLEQGFAHPIKPLFLGPGKRFQLVIFSFCFPFKLTPFKGIVVEKGQQEACFFGEERWPQTCKKVWKSVEKIGNSLKILNFSLTNLLFILIDR